MCNVSFFFTEIPSEILNIILLYYRRWFIVRLKAARNATSDLILLKHPWEQPWVELPCGILPCLAWSAPRRERAERGPAQIALGTHCGRPRKQLRFLCLRVKCNWKKVHKSYLRETVNIRTLLVKIFLKKELFVCRWLVEKRISNNRKML